MDIISFTFLSIMIYKMMVIGFNVGTSYNLQSSKHDLMKKCDSDWLKLHLISLYKDQAYIYRRLAKRVSNIPSQPSKIRTNQNNFPD